jgi:hypothetical protein
MNLSYQEKSIWASLLAMLVVYGYYFATSQPADLLRMTLAVVTLVVVQVVFQIAVAVSSKVEKKDERDRQIEARAYRNAYLILVCGGLWVIYLSYGAFPVAQAVLAALVLSEVAKSVTQLYYYRQGV